MQDFLQRDYFGNSLEKWAITLILILASVVVGKGVYWLLLAGLGIGGLALAMAAKDTVSNEAGLEFAFPTQTIYAHGVGGDES